MFNQVLVDIFRNNERLINHALFISDDLLLFSIEHIVELDEHENKCKQDSKQSLTFNIL